MNCNIDTNYPGGNIHVISINDDRVHVEQELRDTEPWWFYWNFRVQVQGKAEITFTFENGEVVGPFGPAISKDGVHWYYDKKTTFLDHQSFRFAFQEETVYFAFSIPYQYAQFETFYEQNKENPLLTRHLFAVSEKGRDIPPIEDRRGTQWAPYLADLPAPCLRILRFLCTGRSTVIFASCP